MNDASRESDQFETGVSAIDGTRNGMFGGPVDFNRRMVRGIRWYRINGVEVSQEEYERRWNAQNPPLASVKD